MDGHLLKYQVSKTTERVAVVSEAACNKHYQFCPYSL